MPKSSFARWLWQESPVKAMMAVYAIVMGMLIFVLPMAFPVRAADPVSGRLVIPAANIAVNVTKSWMEERKIYVPDYIVGAYQRGNKKLLVGHSVTAFQDLPKVKLGDEVFYDGQKYMVIRLWQQKAEEVDMTEVLRDTGEDTLILMTCAGERDSERLMLTAKRL